MGGPSFEVMQIGRALADRTVRRSIDLGAGTGRNSLFLASEGFDATLVERDSRLCSDARSLSADRQLILTIFEEDLRYFKPNGDYDLVLLLGILHFLLASDAVSVIERFQESTTALGAHLITIAPSLSVSRETNSLVDQGYLGLVSREIIEKAYRNWYIISYERYRKTDDHLSGGIETHVIEKFVLAPNAIGKLAQSTSRVTLLPEGKLDGKNAELARALNHRHNYKDVERRYGPADSIVTVTGSEKNISLIGPSNSKFTLSIAFWGRVKCYFENDRLTGFAVYETEHFHTFLGRGNLEIINP